MTHGGRDCELSPRGEFLSHPKVIHTPGLFGDRPGLELVTRGMSNVMPSGAQGDPVKCDSVHPETIAEKGGSARLHDFTHGGCSARLFQISGEYHNRKTIPEQGGDVHVTAPGESNVRLKDFGDTRPQHANAICSIESSKPERADISRKDVAVALDASVNQHVLNLYGCPQRSYTGIQDVQLKWSGAADHHVTHYAMSNAETVGTALHYLSVSKETCGRKVASCENDFHTLSKRGCLTFPRARSSCTRNIRSCYQVLEQPINLCAISQCSSHSSWTRWGSKFKSIRMLQIVLFLQHFPKAYGYLLSFVLAYISAFWYRIAATSLIRLVVSEVSRRLVPVLLSPLKKSSFLHSSSSSSKPMAPENQPSSSRFYSPSYSGVKFVFLLISVLLLTPTPGTGARVKANIHAIIPRHFGMTTDLSREFRNTVLNFKRDRRNSRLMAAFQTEESLTFIKDDTPHEILKAFCDDVLKRQTVTILNINNPLSIRRRTSSNHYVLELASYLGIPVISWDTQFSGTQLGSVDRALQLAPTIDHQARAMVSLLDRYNWTSFSVVTSQVAGAMEFLSSIEHLVQLSTKKAMASPADAKKESMEILSTIHIRDIKDTRKQLSTLVGSDTRVFLLHCSSLASYDIIEAAVDLGLTGRDYVWILTRSSIPTGKYAPRAFPVGLMGISYEHAIDAMKRVVRVGVKTWLNALAEMARRPALLSQMTIPPKFTCDSIGDTFWKDGSILYNYMQNVTIRDEPQIAFNINGTLKQTEVLIMNLQWQDGARQRKIFKEVGRWKRHGLTMDDITWPGEVAIPPSGKPKRAFLRVATLHELPYVIYREPEEDGKCEQKALPCWVYERNQQKEILSNVTIMKCCVGLSMDLLKILSDKLNFDFDLREVKDGKWGALNKATKKFNGLVRILQDDEADIVMTSFKINPERARAVLFSVPYLETGIKIIVALRKGAISPTAFLEPFDFFSWLLIVLLSVHVIATAIFVFEKLVEPSPSRRDKEPYDYASWSIILVFSVHATGSSILIFEWLSPYGLNRGLTPMRDHKFSLFRSFWLIWAMLFSTSVQTDNPRGIASRFLANIWALFALVFLASYTANLAAFMITKEEYYDLSGIQDYRLQNPYTMNPPFKYATTRDGSTEANIRTNHKEMHKYMKTLNQPDVDAGISALKQGDIQAFIYDSSVLEYYASRDPKCRLVTVGNRYAMTGYGVGFPPDFTNPWIDKVNKVILKLQENGELDRLQKFWLAGACNMRKEKGVSNRTLGILNFTSAFILLGSGVLLGLLILVFEHIYFKFGRQHLRKLDKCGCCALVSLSMGKSLRMKDVMDEAITLYTKNRCKDPVCETQMWKLRHQLDMALLKVDKLQTQLSGMNGNLLTLGPSSTQGLGRNPPNSVNGTRSQARVQAGGRDGYDGHRQLAGVGGGRGGVVTKQHPRYAAVNLPEVVYSKNGGPSSDADNMAGSFERFFENFDRSPVSGDMEQFSVQLLPQPHHPLDADGCVDHGDGGRLGLGHTSFDDADGGSSSGGYHAFRQPEDISSDGGSLRAGSSAASRASPNQMLLRRTPSYTSAVGGSLASDLGADKSPAPSGRVRQFDGKKYMGVDSTLIT